MYKTFVIAGAACCFLAVAIGAFGAHALENVLQGKTQAWFNTAVDYQFIHGLGLLFCGLCRSASYKYIRAAGFLMLIGVCVFSGTLYAMALGAPTWLGMVTPIGGLCLLFSWAVIAWSAAIAENPN